ncbi:sensor histidine kinase [Spirosoma rhododendri]|uniref:histidine kinase n=1 Tax=Spirosoma rhododendri TaxID=2728024 RepID=A0A7L5DU05_9BACT|nr:HAMP domain-containing sensor histidine kinase [Spirosoma rhododendri]QJD81585.1 HAMP domain-containing histidine kinase [Spirosoma rhododendri]
MENPPTQQPYENDPVNRHLIRLEQMNQELIQQITNCRQELDQAQSALGEARIVLAQRYRLEVEQDRLLTQERGLNELKSNFITLASHEFRTPMMTILSSASLIGRYSGSEEGDERERHVQRIKAAVNSLTTMLNDFLAISQIDQYVPDSSTQSLDVTALCREVIMAVQTTAKPQQRFHYQPQTGPLQLQLDRQLLERILVNLLTNASKYSPDDTDIQLTSTIWNRRVLFTVADQGIGIPDSDKDRLFTHFFRSRNANHMQGVGLGLYLAKRYAELLGGSITFTSKLEQGTTFTVELPLLTGRA